MLLDMHFSKMRILSCTMIIYTNYLNLEKSLPNMVCMGMRNKRTPIPAKHDGPISAHSKPTTAAAWRGPIHKKCRKIGSFKWEKEFNCWANRMHKLEKPLILGVRISSHGYLKLKSTLQFSLTMTLLGHHPWDSHLYRTRTSQNI